MMWEEELGKIGEWGELEEGMVEGEVERVEEKVEATLIQKEKVMEKSCVSVKAL